MVLFILFITVFSLNTSMPALRARNFPNVFFFIFWLSLHYFFLFCFVAQICHRNSPARVSPTTRPPPRFDLPSLRHHCIVFFCGSCELILLRLVPRYYRADFLSSGQGRFRRQGPQRVQVKICKPMSCHEAECLRKFAIKCLIWFEGRIFFPSKCRLQNGCFPSSCHTGALRAVQGAWVGIAGSIVFFRILEHDPETQLNLCTFITTPEIFS